MLSLLKSDTSEVTWEWYNGFDLPEGDVLSYDVETSWFEDKTNKMIQIAVSNGTDTVVARGAHSQEDIVTDLMRSGRTLVGHNAWWADVPWINEYIEYLGFKGWVFPWGEDTMVLGYLMDENQSLSLKNLARRYLGVNDWKEGLNAPKDSDEFALYNAQDACYTVRLRNHFVNRLGDRKRIADRIIFPAFLALRECTERGIYISPDAVANAENHFKGQISQLQAILETDHGITKPRSMKIVGEALHAEGHSLARTTSGQFSTSRGTVARLKSTPMVDTLRRFRVADKAYSAFVKPYKKIVESEDGRAHSQYSIIRTVTGRTSASGPNIQQLPREPLLRAFFSAPVGSTLVSADYSAIEFRVAAWVAGEQGIIDRYRANPGFDPHTWVTAQFYGIPESEVTKEQRQIFKSYNFGLLYMAQPKTVREYILKTTGILISMDEAWKGYNFWHKTFPAFKKWYVRTWRTLKLYGYIQTFTGRRRHFVCSDKFDTPYLWSTDSELDYLEALVDDQFGDDSMSEDNLVTISNFKSSVEECYVFDVAPRYLPLICRQPKWKRQADLREATNDQVQSPSADIALLGLSECNVAGLPINAFIHDSNSFELPGEKGTRPPVKLIEKCMIERPIQVLRDEFGVDFDMPLQVEIK